MQDVAFVLGSLLIVCIMGAAIMVIGAFAEIAIRKAVKFFKKRRDKNDKESK